MSLKKYIEETARRLEAPVTGDEFDFQINESLSIECEVVEHSDNSYVIAVDQLAYDMLKEADAIDESKMCEQCHMGSMYSTSEGKMQCDECGYSMTTESAGRALQRARDSGIDVERNGIGDGYYIGRDVHDYGDNVKVAYNLYYLEDPAGLENELVPAFREVGGLDVSPYRPKPEEIKAAAARLKIKDQVNSKLGPNESAQNSSKIDEIWPFSKKKTATKPKRFPEHNDDLEQWMRDKIAYLKSIGSDPAIVFSPATGDYFPLTFHASFSYNDAAKQAYRNIKREYPDLVKRARKEISNSLAMRVSQSRVGDDEDWPEHAPSHSSLREAEYQGRQVKLGKPMAGDTAKYKVYVRDPKTGNIKKVNFGDKNMSIKRDNPARRKNFRARHNCSSKKDRTTAGYWSCRMWSKKPVSKILKGK